MQELYEQALALAQSRDPGYYVDKLVTEKGESLYLGILLFPAPEDSTVLVAQYDLVESLRDFRFLKKER